MDYNNNPGGNPLGLVPAYRLYDNAVYQRLVDRLGIANVYILSAGWILLRADFLTPVLGHHDQRERARRRRLQTASQGRPI
jgi:hypothetical protein